MGNNEINQLVEKARQGDQQSFSMLIVQFSPKIERVIAHYVPDIEDVHDIAQEAFIKMYKNLNEFRGESSFYTWFYRIAINAAKTYNRHKKHYMLLLDVDDEVVRRQEYLFLEERASPELLLAGVQLQKRINQEIAHMPKELRRALLLREMGGLSYERAARVMHCPIGTVRSRIFRARAYLAEHLEI